MSIDRSIYRGVPADFPISEAPSALSGAHPKMSLIEEDGKFYALGTSPSEVATAYDVCEDVVKQMIPYCDRKLGSFNGDRKAILKAALQGLIHKNWCTVEQCGWIIREVAKRLGWPLLD